MLHTNTTECLMFHTHQRVLNASDTEVLNASDTTQSA